MAWNDVSAGLSFVSKLSVVGRDTSMIGEMSTIYPPSSIAGITAVPWAEKVAREGARNVTGTGTEDSVFSSTKSRPTFNSSFASKLPSVVEE